MRKNVRLAPVVVLAICASMSVAAGTPAATIAQLERQLNDALNSVDTVTVDRLWADDFVFVSPAGRISNKRQRLAGMKPVGSDAAALVSTLDDVQVKVYGSVAVAIVKTTWRGTIESKNFIDPYVATHVWVLSGSSWRLTFAQVAQVERKS